MATKIQPKYPLQPYCKDGSHHLVCSLNEDKRLSEVDNIKIKIVHEFINFYKKYPTLHFFNLTYAATSTYRPQGWSAWVSQVLTDTLANIEQTEAYKKMNIVIAGFSGNYLNGKKDDLIIPDITGQFCSYNQLNQEINTYFSYLNNSDSGKKLAEQMKMIAKDNSDLRISISARDMWGYVNRNFQEDVDKFLGEDLLVHARHSDLEDKMNPVTKTIKSKSLKI